MKFITLLLLFSIKLLDAQTYQFKTIEIPAKVNFRGLSVVNDSVVWISGPQGHVGKSTDGGKNWNLTQVAGFEKFDFRSIHAFDAFKVVIANAGTPASILITTDGGLHWNTAYRNYDSAAFFDGISFWNDTSGIIYGDPINERLLLLKTGDGGFTWELFPDESRPVLQPNEASFAASGTGIRCVDKEKIIICTGGSVTRLLISDNSGKTWDTLHTPVISGRSSTGVFSVAYRNRKKFIVVGGDYIRDTLKTNHVFYTKDGGKNWIAPKVPTRGYRECVTYLSKKTVIAAGPTGIDISTNGGKNWEPLSDEKTFHTIAKARKGKLIIATGKGKVAVISN